MNQYLYRLVRISIRIDTLASFMLYQRMGLFFEARELTEAPTSLISGQDPGPVPLTNS